MSYDSEPRTPRNEVDVEVDRITFVAKIPHNQTAMFVETLNRLARIASIHERDYKVTTEFFGVFPIHDRRLR